MVKYANTEISGLVPGLGFLEGEAGSHSSYSCLNSMGRGAWKAIVHGVIKGQT